MKIAALLAFTQIVAAKVLLVSTSISDNVDYFQESLTAKAIAYDQIVVAKWNTLNIAGLLNGKVYTSIIFADGELGFNYNSGWRSALNATQWKAFDDYETKTAAKRVMFNVYPNAKYGTNPIGIGMSNATYYLNSQYKGLVNPTFTATSTFNGQGLYMWLAQMTSTASTFAKPIVHVDYLGSKTTVGVVNYLRGTRQVIFHFPCDNWSVACNAFANYWVPSVL